MNCRRRFPAINRVFEGLPVTGLVNQSLALVLMVWVTVIPLNLNAKSLEGSKITRQGIDGRAGVHSTEPHSLELEKSTYRPIAKVNIDQMGQSARLEQEMVEVANLKQEPTKWRRKLNASDTFWAVQVGSYKSENLAHQLVERIRAIGFGARMVTVDLAQGRFHRVYANGFLDELSALEAKRNLDLKLHINSIVGKI
jgi:cell division septation protein DedD